MTLRLRTFLILLLISTSLITFTIVGSGLLFYQLPRIVEKEKARVESVAENVTSLLENSLTNLEVQLRPIIQQFGSISPQAMHLLFTTIVSENGFEAIYLVKHDGAVELSTNRTDLKVNRQALTGADFSASELFLQVLASNQPVWSDRYLSAYSGEQMVAIAYPLDTRILIAELPTYRLRNLAAKALSTIGHLSLVIDRRGEWVTDNRTESGLKYTNWNNHPIVTAARAGISPPDETLFLNRTVYPAYRVSEILQWTVVTVIPAGMSNPEYSRLVTQIALGFLSIILVGILLAPLWAARMLRPVKRLIDESKKIGQGEYSAIWREGVISELNELGETLTSMARKINRREQSLAASEKKLKEIFNHSPGPMLISRYYDDEFRVDEVNDALEQLFKVKRQEIQGKSGKEIGWWMSVEDRQRFLEAFFTDGLVKDFEVWMKDTEGTPILCRLSAAHVLEDHTPLDIFIYQDITKTHEMQADLKALNLDLEKRVKERTRELEKANRDLADTVHTLEIAKDELVQSEKLAALGGMVAGIAHELGTPVGNSKIAMTTLRDHLGSFHKQMETGLRRSTLENFLEDIDTATDISTRNLEKANLLIMTFKQVAADRTSSQRRSFNLHEVIDEVLLTMHPTLKRSSVKVLTDVDITLNLDSYPGSLGQVVTNLINNALMHGFGEEEEGEIIIRAKSKDVRQLTISIEDNGKGMDEAILNRVFEPFFTTRLGSGGTGLGMHLIHNIITNILGGKVQVWSQPGEGTRVIVDIPLNAPGKEPSGSG